MPSRGQSITLAYTAWDTVANAGKTGNVANHVLRWIKDGTAAAPTNTPTEVDATNAPGIYKLTLTATECTCDFGVLAGKSSTANVSLMPIAVSFEQLPTAAPAAAGGLPTVGSGAGQVNPSGGRVGPDWANVGGAATTVLLTGTTVGTATSLTNLPAVPAGWLTAAGIAAGALAGKGDWLAPTVAGRTLDVSATGEAGVDWANVGGAATAVNLSGTTISTGQAVASVAGAVGSVTGNVGGNVTGSVGSLATQAKTDTEDAVWNAAQSGHATAGTFGLYLDATVSSRGTYAGADTSGTTTLLARLTATRAGLLDNLDATVSSRGTFAGGAVAAVTGDVGGKVLGGGAGTIAGTGVRAVDGSGNAIAPAATALSTAQWTNTRATNLDNLDAAISTRSTLSAAGVWDLATTGHTTSGTFGAAMNAAGSAGDPWATSLPGAYGAGTAGNLVGNNPDTAGTTTLLSRLTATRAGNLDNLDAAVSTRSTLTAAGAWDLAISGHTTAGTTGAALSAAGSAGDPWSTPLPGAYGAGTAGNLIGNRLDAAVSTRSSHTAANVWGVARSGNQGAGTFGEYLDAATSTRSTYAGGDTAGTTTLLARLTAGRATGLDNLDAAVSTRLAAADYAAAPSAATIATQVNATLGGTHGTGSWAAADVSALATAAALTAVAAGVSAIQAQTTTTGVKLLLTQAGLTPRPLDSVADASLTVGDALACAVATAAGKGIVSGTEYDVKTPFTGTTIRTFTLDSATAPTSRQ
jgi:hypothetical protein